MSVAAESTETLLAGLESSLARADRADTARLVSATVEIEPEIDPAAIAAGSRFAADRWFSWEQPDRDFALAGLGTAIQVISRGENRFRDLAERCAHAMHDRVSEEPGELPAGAGPVWSTGLAFGPRGGSEPLWSSLPPALAVMPEVAIARTDGRAFLTASVPHGPGAQTETVLDRVTARIGSLRTGGPLSGLARVRRVVMRFAWS